MMFRIIFVVRLEKIDMLEKVKYTETQKHKAVQLDYLATATSLASAENSPVTAFGRPKKGPPIFITALICFAHQFGPPPPPIGAGASTHFIKCKKYRTPMECGITTTLLPPFVDTMSSMLLLIPLNVWSLIYKEIIGLLIERQAHMKYTHEVQKPEQEIHLE